MFILEHDALADLLNALRNEGFIPVGPTYREGAILLDEIHTRDDLPTGMSDEQTRASYIVTHNGTPENFGFRPGPYSWKRFLVPPRQLLYSVAKEGKGFVIEQQAPPEPVHYAFIGVRPCELRALMLLDDVFYEGEYADALYQRTRRKAFIVAVNCLHPGTNCFCSSMGTGPRASAAYDLAMTELMNGSRCKYAVEVGSEEGQELLAKVDHRAATQGEIEDVLHRFEAAEQSFSKSVDIRNIREILNDNFEHPQWDDIARRCMACANCTMVCPTCFCSTTEDITDLTGEKATRMRRWDSCFTSDFTKIAGGNIRMSTRTRYRQWLMHKFAHWQDQFDAFGCVGCGRCITWCPVGIDLTKELSTIRETSQSPTTV